MDEPLIETLTTHHRSNLYRLRRMLLIVSLVAGGVLLQPGALPAEPVAVRYAEGVVHGFLILRTLELTNGNKNKAAQMLRLKRTTLIEKLKRFDS